VKGGLGEKKGAGPGGKERGLGKGIGANETEGEQI